ncbi:MAG: Dabb family protein [Actinobacteria bacterium]|nr:Dabb family protein [Actinomycetota bacterium]
MFRHVVLFRWNPDADDAAKAAIAAGLAALPAAIPTIRGYRFGADAGVNEGNWDYAVTADFDDEAGYLVYRDHPAHRQVVVDHIAPAIGDRAAVQFDSRD